MKSCELCFYWQAQQHLSQKHLETPEQGCELSRGRLAGAEGWFSPGLGWILLPQLQLQGMSVGEPCGMLAPLHGSACATLNTCRGFAVSVPEPEG